MKFKLTKKQRRFLSRKGKAGAKAQSAAMTPEQRTERAKMAAAARWTGHKTSAVFERYDGINAALQRIK